jgi:hypothetical protein
MKPLLLSSLPRILLLATALLATMGAFAQQLQERPVRFSEAMSGNRFFSTGASKADAAQRLRASFILPGRSISYSWNGTASKWSGAYVQDFTYNALAKPARVVYRDSATTQITGRSI